MKKDLSRYARQMAIPEIGKEGQLRLLESSVLIVGCGALGSMIGMELSGAGVGRIGIADFDTVDPTNLQRQFFFKDNESGKEKVRLLGERMVSLNPQIKIEEYKEVVSNKRAEDIFPTYDIIIDATDNPASKLMVDEVSSKLKLNCIIGGVEGFRGQVFTLIRNDKDHSRYSDIFQIEPDSGFLPCSLGGVVGPAAAVCASIQSCEAIKIAAGIKDRVQSRIIIFDLLEPQFSVFYI